MDSQDNPPASYRPNILEWMCCDKCGSKQIRFCKYYSRGMGVGLRPFREDVFCRNCGHIGVPKIEDNSEQITLN